AGGAGSPGRSLAGARAGHPAPRGSPPDPGGGARTAARRGGPAAPATRKLAVVLPHPAGQLGSRAGPAAGGGAGPRATGRATTGRPDRLARELAEAAPPGSADDSGTALPVRQVAPGGRVLAEEMAEPDGLPGGPAARGRGPGC